MKFTPHGGRASHITSKALRASTRQLNKSLFGVIIAECVDDGFQLRLHQSRHVCEPGQRVGQRKLREHDGPFGNVGRIVTDAFQVSGDFERTYRAPQIVGDRIYLPCEGLTALQLDPGSQSLKTLWQEKRLAV